MALPRKKAIKAYPSAEEHDAFQALCEQRGVSMNRIICYLIHLVNVRADKTDRRSLDKILRDLSSRPQRRETLRKAHETTERLKQSVTQSTGESRNADARPGSVSSSALDGVDFLE